eukprot:6481322-Amphidinium_carterae.2
MESLVKDLLNPAVKLSSLEDISVLRGFLWLMNAEEKSLYHQKVRAFLNLAAAGDAPATSGGARPGPQHVATKRAKKEDDTSKCVKLATMRVAPNMQLVHAIATPHGYTIHYTVAESATTQQTT